MSTFNGQIEEIRGISVDEFTTASHRAYFLSHFHSDHTRGLRELDTKSPVYATPITSLLIQRKCPELAENLRTLEVGLENSVELEEGDEGEPALNFVVTAIPAGHCLGSCMLLFQIENCDILYTGDFRISLKDAQNLKTLKEFRNQPNTVVYLDSTFMKKSFENFPTQSESVKEILKIVEKFLGESRNHKVHLMTPARYGYEYLLMQLHSKLGLKSFINETEVYEQYISISQLESCVTKDERNTKIFLTPTFISDSKESAKNDEILHLQLSAWFWTDWTRQKPFVAKMSKNHYRVCYATHNSFSEIRDFLTFLKPKKVVLNVLPECPHEKRLMFEQLAKVQEQFAEKNTENENSEHAGIAPKKFTFKRIRELSTQKVDKKLKS